MSLLLYNTYNTEKGFSSPYSGNSLYEIVVDIKTKICPKDIVIIYINMRVGSGKQIEDQQGIELLVRLRLEGIMNHCILHSPETLFDVIAKNNRNSIVASLGTSFRRTEYNFKKYFCNDSNQYNQQATKKDFILHLKKYFDIGEMRHRFANKYGVYILSKIYNDYVRDSHTEEEIYCSFTENDKFMLDVFRYMANQDADSQNYASVISEIKKVRNGFSKSGPWVLYIDDMAEDGWKNFFVKSIYSDNNSNRFIVDVPQKTDFDKDSYPKYLRKVFDIISASRETRFIECVLLDVRLMDEEGIYEDIEKLSGIRLLNDIREKFPELPVIITTASNKADTVSHVFKAGASALWTKPGLDYIYSDDYYLKQYLQILRSLSEANKKYKNRLEKEIARAGNTLVALSANINEKKVSFKNHIYNNIDAVIIDTNIFCLNDKLSKLSTLYSSIYKLYYFCKKNNKMFVVIDDVYLEIIKNARKKDDSDYALKKVSEFALQVLDNFFINASNCYFELLTNSDISWHIRKRKNINNIDIFVVTSEHIQSRYCHNNQKEAEKYKNNAQVHSLIHADDSLSYLATSLCCKKNKNILFLSDDRQLKKRIAIEANVRYCVDVGRRLTMDVERYNDDIIKINCSSGKYIEMMPHRFICELFK